MVVSGTVIHDLSPLMTLRVAPCMIRQRNALLFAYLAIACYTTPAAARLHGRMHIRRKTRLLRLEFWLHKVKGPHALKVESRSVEAHVVRITHT